MGPYGFSGRGMSGRNSPLSLGGRLGGLAGFGGTLAGGLGPISGGLINPLALAQIGVGSIGGIGGLGGFAALGGGFNNFNPLALSGVGNNGLLGNGGFYGRGRMSPILSGAANLPYINALAALPRSAGFSPNTLPSLSRQRGRGILGGNTQPPHYVYPPAEQHFSIPLIVTRQNGLLDRMSDPTPTVLTIPVGATVQDIFEEIHKGKWQYDYQNVWMVMRNMDEYLLAEVLDCDAEVLIQLDVAFIAVMEQ